MQYQCAKVLKERASSLWLFCWRFTCFIQGDVSLGVDVGKATEMYQRLGYPTGVEVSMAASSIGNLVATLLSLAILVRNYNSGHYDSHHHHRLHEEGFDPRINPSLTPNPDPYPYP